MALRLEDKKAIVSEVSAVANTALSAVTADYRGLTVGQMNALRARARKANIYLRVVRNTLAKRAIAGTEFECMSDTLVGSLIVAFSQNEPGAAARLFRDFSKEHDNFKVKALALNGTVHGVDQLEAIATLPTREEALATLLNVMQAPITKFVRTLAEPHTQVVRALAAVRDQKQA